MAGRSDLRLVAATPEHFGWAIAGVESILSPDGLRLPPGGVDSPRVLAWIESSSQAVAHATGEPGAWLMVAGDEVVGIISLKAPPHEGVVEIGYGVAESRRGRGHATRGVALVIEEVARRGLSIVAETAPSNHASQIVLERNGLRRCGERLDFDDGRIVRWSLGAR